jgi:hypothetical protein
MRCRTYREDVASDSSLIRVCLPEFTDPGQVADLFVVLNRNDLIEAQFAPRNSVVKLDL